MAGSKPNTVTQTLTEVLKTGGPYQSINRNCFAIWPEMSIV